MKIINNQTIYRCIALLACLFINGCVFGMKRPRDEFGDVRVLPDPKKRRVEIFDELTNQFKTLSVGQAASDRAIGEDLDVEMSTSEVPFLTAIRTGDVFAVQSLIKQGADLTVTDANQASALHYAAVLEQPAIMKLLLTKIGTLDQRDSEGRTPMHWAAQKGNSSIVKMLYDFGANILPDNKGNLPQLPPLKQVSSMQSTYKPWQTKLMSKFEGLASEKQKLVLNQLCILLKGHFNPFVVIYSPLDLFTCFCTKHMRETFPLSPLLKKGSLKYEIVHRMITPIRDCVQKFHALPAQSCYFLLDLIDKELPKTLKPLCGAFNGNLLASAIKINDINLARFALESVGIKIDAPLDGKNLLPIHFAAECGTFKMFSFLCDLGADIDAQMGERGRKPLGLAVANSNMEVVTYLLEQSKLSVDEQWNLVDCALHGKQPEMLKYLIKRFSLDPKRTFQSSFRFRGGETLLHRLESWKRRPNENTLAMVKCLVKLGVDINAQDSLGRKPFEFAARARDLEVMKYMVEKAGPALSVIGPDENGDVPTDLHWVCGCEGDDEQDASGPIDYLLGLGTLIDCRDSYGDTPLALAVHPRDIKTVNYLLKKGADSNAQPFLHDVIETSDDGKLMDDEDAEIIKALRIGGADLNLAIKCGYKGRILTPLQYMYETLQPNDSILVEGLMVHTYRMKALMPLFTGSVARLYYRMGHQLIALASSLENFEKNEEVVDVAVLFPELLDSFNKLPFEVQQWVNTQMHTVVCRLHPEHKDRGSEIFTKVENSLPVAYFTYLLAEHVTGDSTCIGQGSIAVPENSNEEVKQILRLYEMLDYRGSDKIPTGLCEQLIDFAHVTITKGLNREAMDGIVASLLKRNQLLIACIKNDMQMISRVNVPDYEKLEKADPENYLAPLKFVARYGTVELMKLLYSKGMYERDRMEDIGIHTKSSVCCAASSDSVSMVAFLIDMKLQCAGEVKDSDIWHVACIAAEENRSAVLNYLVQRYDFLLSFRGGQEDGHRWKKTLFENALESYHDTTEAAKYLIDVGSKVDSSVSLALAAENGKSKVVDYLLAGHGGKLLPFTSESDEGPLHCSMFSFWFGEVKKSYQTMPKIVNSLLVAGVKKDGLRRIFSQIEEDMKWHMACIKMRVYLSPEKPTEFILAVREQGQKLVDMAVYGPSS